MCMVWLFPRSSFKKNNQPTLIGINLEGKEKENDRDQILNSEITNEEVMQIISKLKDGKSQGTDGLGLNFIKARII